VLVVPPAGPGSLGDEAMLLALVDGLRARGARARVAAAARAGRPAGVVAVGADVLDGFYGPEPAIERVRLLTEAARAGLPTAVVSASLNEAPHPLALRALRRLPADTRLCWRDPASLRRAQRLLERPGRLVADLAFLLAPRDDGAGAALGWIAARRADGGRVVGVNANGLVERLCPDWAPGATAGLHARLVRELLEGRDDLSVLLVPHDRRAQADDAALARGVRGLLPARLGGRCAVAEGLGAAQAKAVCARLDLVVTGRMHLGIAALGAGTPAVCMDYQGKVAGLYEHVGLTGLSFLPGDLREPGAVASLALEALGRRDLRGRLRGALARVRRLARGNLDL